MDPTPGSLVPRADSSGGCGVAGIGRAACVMVAKGKEDKARAMYHVPLLWGPATWSGD